MEITYGAGVTRHIIPDVDSWRRNNPDSAQVPNLSRQNLESALTDFQTTPSLNSFHKIESCHRAFQAAQPLRIVKRVAGTAQPPSAADSLKDDLARHKAFLTGRDTVKAKVASALAELGWQERAICAELYTQPEQASWAPLTENDILALECEASASSKWAHLPPKSLSQWAEIGEKEIAALSQWPALGFTARSAIQTRNLGEWPTWQDHAPFARKGLFCHSSAAIAAAHLFENRSQLVSGTQFHIYSIAAAHQQASEPGGITHWYLVVNAPEAIQYDGRTSRPLSLCADYQILDLAGGFVVDIWGALWEDQQPNRYSSAVSDQSTTTGCVFNSPSTALLGNTRVKIWARQTWPLNS